MACTKSHLLLLADDQSLISKRFATNDRSDDADDDSDDTNTQQKQLKLLLRVKKSYNTAVLTSPLTLLICARGGTLDLFKVGHHAVIAT